MIQYNKDINKKDKEALHLQLYISCGTRKCNYGCVECFIYHSIKSIFKFFFIIGYIPKKKKTSRFLNESYKEVIK